MWQGTTKIAQKGRYLMTLGEKLRRIYELRDEKDELSEQVKEINKQIDELEWQVLQGMEENALDRMDCDRGSATRNVKLYPKIADKDEFLAYVFESGKTEMLVANVNQAAFRDHFETFNTYPDGVDAYEKATLNYRRSR